MADPPKGIPGSSVPSELPSPPKSPDPLPPSAEVGPGNPSSPIPQSSPAGTQNSGDELLSPGAQRGVLDIEATTIVWTKTHIVMAYVMIWIIYFVDSVQQSSTASLTVYVTSSFGEHHLTATTQVMSQLIGGLSKLTLAKILDVWGRPQGYLLCVVLLTVGLVMMATCRNVQTYAAAQVFYWVGFNNLGYSLSVFIADTSSLKNRGLMLAFASSPYIITTWIGGPIAASLLAGPGWRWGFAIFALVTPIATLPLFFVFYHNHRKARRLGLVPRARASTSSPLSSPPPGRPRAAGRSLLRYAVEFDAVGLLLATAGWALLLVPFNIAPADPASWSSPRIICMIVFGVLLLVAFVLWERFAAPVTFLPYALLTDRTVLGACVLACALFVSYYIWTNFFPSFLQVVVDLSVTEASYVSNVYSIGSCLCSFVVGALIRRSGRFRWVALYFGVPLTALGVGLMLLFRRPGVHVGYLVMCEVLIAFAGGALVICEQMAVMAAVTHQHVATVLALEAMFAAVGGAIGSTVAAAIWGAVFPVRLREYLPPSEQANFAAIYGSLEVQRSYPVGSETRTAISLAYGDAQRNMLVVALAVHGISLAAVMTWRDLDVKDFKQTKGNVI